MKEESVNFLINEMDLFFLIKRSSLIASRSVGPTRKTATKFQGLYFEVKVLNGLVLCSITRRHGSVEYPT